MKHSFFIFSFVTSSIVSFNILKWQVYIIPFGFLFLKHKMDHSRIHHVSVLAFDNWILINGIKETPAAMALCGWNLNDVSTAVTQIWAYCYLAVIYFLTLTLVLEK